MKPQRDLLLVDGSYGEGGGQILRSAASLAAATGRPMRIVNIRAGRPKPGLAAQHVTALRAAAAVCGARLEGDALGSVEIAFHPAHPPRAGAYFFDVGAAREGGSAGAATLVLQTVLPALLVADGGSAVTVRGGTHMAWSPSFDYLRDIWVPALAVAGATIALELAAWGWYPVGRGEIRARIEGLGALPRRRLDGLTLSEPGELQIVRGRAVAAELPEHIPQRMAARAEALLRAAGHRADIAAERVHAACPGAGIFLAAEYRNVRCGFAALGRPGKPSETVAEEAVAELVEHHRNGGGVDRHLSDQLLVPLALAAGPSQFTVAPVSRHLETNAWIVNRFGLARVEIERRDGGPARVSVLPQT
jgi:RNA 3'-terminal phosphate cyclase (ATP)